MYYLIYTIIGESTTIQIDKPTREALKELRITEREIYDEIIKRLIKNAKNL
jgi:hypothetical protein